MECCHQCQHQFTPAHGDQDICSACSKKIAIGESVRRRTAAARKQGRLEGLEDAAVVVEGSMYRYAKLLAAAIRTMKRES
jgi:hypothetical protein